MGCGASAKKYKVDDAGKEETLSFLSKVPLFKQLPQSDHPLLAEACDPKDFNPGETVIKQGDMGKEFFVIRSGEAAVHISDEEKAQGRKSVNLKAGDYFGEKALVHDVPRTATIVALSHLSTLRITREKFRELGLNEKLHFRRRKGVAKHDLKTKAKQATQKSPADRLFISEALKQNQNLQVMVALDEERVQNMVDICWKENVPISTEIISEDDAQADYFYVIQEGAFEISMTVKGQSGQDMEGKTNRSYSTKRIGPGSSFGELALLCLAPRSATVKAAQDSVVWVFDRDNFKRILMRNTTAQIQLQVEYLESVEMLQCLLPSERQTIAEAFLELHYSKDETIFVQGQQGTAFYVLVEGDVEIMKDGTVLKTLSANKDTKETRYFGEMALLNRAPRTATVKVTSDIAQVLVLDRESFDLLLGPLEDIIKEAEASGNRRAATPAANGRVSKKLTEARAQEREKIFWDELTNCGMLGCGGFGTVDLVEHKKTGQVYALKSMSKGFIVESGMQTCVMSEKEILWMCDSPFIIRLYAAFNTKEHLQLLLEIALGGDLHVAYQRRGLYGSKTHAAFYTAGVTCAFEHLHSFKVVYRDLKPENVLVNDQGHVKLTDMGLAKICLGKTHTVCGTPDYFAPEMLKQAGHSFGLDWWTLGIFIFELLAGDPPFEAADPMSIYRNICQGINKVKFPPSCAPPAAGLIKGLLVESPSRRIPMLSGGVANLEKHSFYAGLDWHAFRELKVPPPYKPTLQHAKDKKNFRAHPGEAPPQVPYKDDGSGWDKDFASP